MYVSPAGWSTGSQGSWLIRRSQPQWCMRENHVTDKHYPGFSFTCHIWSRNRELTKGRAQNKDQAASAMAEGTQTQTRSWENSDSPPSKGEIPAQQVPAGRKEDLNCDLSRSLGSKVSLCTEQLGSKLEWPQASRLAQEESGMSCYDSQWLLKD